jgi:hypothetical protein
VQRRGDVHCPRAGRDEPPQPPLVGAQLPGEALVLRRGRPVEQLAQQRLRHHRPPVEDREQRADQRLGVGGLREEPDRTGPQRLVDGVGRGLARHRDHPDGGLDPADRRDRPAAPGRGHLHVDDGDVGPGPLHQGRGGGGVVRRPDDPHGAAAHLGEQQRQPPGEKRVVIDHNHVHGTPA